MGFFIADKIKIKLQLQGKDLSNCNALVLGVTFKENCPDFRNTKVVDLIKGLKKNKIRIDLFDPWVDTQLFYREYGYKVFNELKEKKYDVIILAVSHSIFNKVNFKNLSKDSNTIIYDIKSFLLKSQITDRL